MAQTHSRRKVTRVRNRRTINIHQIFFGAIAVYIISICYMALTSVHIAGYEVQAGTIAVNHTYTGFAIREENVYSANTSGYVSYYAREGERVSASSLIYTIDEKGEINDFIQQNAEDVDLTDENFSIIRSEISSYMSQYKDLEFYEVYDFQSSIESSIMDLLNQNMLESLEEAGENSLFSRVYAQDIGIVEYYMDGYEQISVETMTEQMLDPATYQKQNLKKELIQTGQSVYKLVKSEDWSLIVPLTADEASKFQQEETQYMEVEFQRDKTTAWANFSIIYVGSTPCARLDFNNSMVRFADLRYIEVEFLIKDESGLKIPNTAIVEKEFYLVNKEYLTTIEEDGKEVNGFKKEIFDENGQSSEEFITMTLYYEDEEYYYIDPKESNFSTGDVKLNVGNSLLHPKTGERFQISLSRSLKGVYNINKGYTQFRQINILYQNEEYTLVEEGTSYGLTIYDHIVLNGEAVDEEEVIY